MNRVYERRLPPVFFFLTGLLSGAAVRFLDLYTTNLGNIFSQLSIWILIGVLLSIYSKTPQSAMVRVLLFCLGMLITYYAVAILTDGVYSWTLIAGWTVFALCSPVLAFFTHRAMGRGIFPVLLRLGILLISVLSSILLFDGFRIYDWVIDGLLVFFLFFPPGKPPAKEKRTA